MSLNKILIIGNVGGVPQIRTVGDQKVAQFSVATTEKRKDKTGNVISETEWHNVTFWGKTAEIAEKYVQKGTQVYVEGRIKTEKYTDKNGNEKFMTRVIGSSMQLLGSKQDEQTSQQRFDPHAAQTTAMQMPDVMDDSDLPF